jgi:streptogramin lyase
MLAGLLALAANAVVLRSAADVPALVGTVRSETEGLMEGVIVIAQRDGSRVLTAVTTNERGQYTFPRTHLRPGKYALTIRAAGYVLSGDRVAVPIVRSASAQVDLALQTASTDQIAHQMTSVEWWRSMPGTDAQKDLLVRKVVNCGFCHEMERVMRTRYTAEQFLPVITRMATYAADNTSACGVRSSTYCDATTSGRVQIQSVARPPETLASTTPETRALAEYLASVNLSGGRTTWSFPLKPLPRPKGRATRAIVTVFPIPRQPTLIHDITVDLGGNVWYGDSGWGYLGKLDTTGGFSEYRAPQHWPDPAPGLKRLVGVQDVEVDPTGKVWAVVGFLGATMAYFDSTNNRWREFEMPAPVWAFLPSFHNAAQAGTMWTVGRPPKSGGMSPLVGYRLNARSGKVDASFPVMVDKDGKDFSGPRRADPFGFPSQVVPFCYQIERDPFDNMICADFHGSNIIVVNAKTGATRVYPTPTPNAAPRRGRADADGRFWFGEFWGDKVGLFDAKTGAIREFPFSTKYMSAYAAAPDAHGEGWASSTGSDRVMRINPNTGETTEYLMPVYYDARKVVVDPSTKRTTIWLPNKNLAQLIRIEPLD